MNLTPAPRAPESATRKELRILRQQIQRLMNCALNRIFDLSERGARRRRHMLLLLVLLLGSLFIFLTVREWMDQFGGFFTYLLVPEYRPTAPDTLWGFALFLNNTFFGSQTWHDIPIIILPFLLALQAAAIYLDDIFGLDDAYTAFRFIWQVSLAGNRKHIRIREGDIHPNDMNSPIYKIGGPGQVEVELDSVAVFEKPDGRPNIIGPTVDGKATLEGFERLRQPLHLRDQYPEPLEVDGRSLDGIPVSSVDVRMFFSIWREGGEATIEHPYPYGHNAVEALTYGQVSLVNLSGPPWSLPPNVWDWARTGTSLIRGELGGFMDEHRLVEFLASIGPPEVQQALQRENDILKAGKAVVPEKDVLQPRPLPTPPDFQARPRVSNLFSQFAREFTERASRRGVELHWVGVGTWKPHPGIVPEKHVDAWRLSSENLARSSSIALKDLRQEIRTQRIISQIQDVPLARFQQSSGRDHNSRERDLLIAYREQLIEAIELLRKSDKHVPELIYQAIDYIEKTLGIEHWVR